MHTKEEPLSRKAQCALFTMNILENLIGLCLIDGPKLITREGRDQLAQMYADGFQIEDSELKFWTHAFVKKDWTE